MMQTPETDAILETCEKQEPEQRLSELARHARRLELERDRAKKSERTTAAKAIIAEKECHDLRKLVHEMQEKITELERFEP